MQSQKKLFFSKDLVVTEIDISNKEQLIRKLSDLLFEKGLVKSTFYQGIMDREAEYPTGLKMKYIGVAIPHTHPNYVIHNSIAVGILKKPIHFKDMIDGESLVEVKIVIMLALNESSKHLDVMQAILEVFKDEEQVKQLLTFSKEEIYVFFQKIFNQTDKGA